MGHTAIRTVYIAALLEIFPNPVTKKLTIKCDKSNPSKQIKIISSLGRIMIIKQFSDTGSAEIDVSSLPAGIYIVAVYNNHTVIHRKLIKD